MQSLPAKKGQVCHRRLERHGPSLRQGGGGGGHDRGEPGQKWPGGQQEGGWQKQQGRRRPPALAGSPQRGACGAVETGGGAGCGAGCRASGCWSRALCLLWWMWACSCAAARPDPPLRRARSTTRYSRQHRSAAAAVPVVELSDAATPTVEAVRPAVAGW